MKIEEKTILWKPVSEYTGGRVLATNGLDILVGELNPEGDCVSEDCSGTHLCGITHFAKIDGFFPTLRESEDEKIRKALIDYFDDANKADENPLQSYGIHTDKAIAWLEKRSEPTDINPSEFDLRLNKLLKQFETLPKEELASSLSFYLNVVQNDGTYREEKQGEQPRYSIGDVLCDKSCTTLNKDAQPNFEITDIRNGMYICDKCSFPISQQDEYELVAKKIEQKPVDKVEPKFHEGDWVVYECGEEAATLQITRIVGKTYVFSDNSTLGVVDEDALRLWDITKDAKDGDVLASELCDSIILFKGIEDNNIQFYCDYDFSEIDVPGDRFAINNGQHYGSVEDSKDFHPATKEQRDTLFAKMREAGYKWDAEKKELKKIEQKPAEWSEEDERIYKSITYSFAHNYPLTIQQQEFVKSLKPQNNITDEELAQAKKDAYNDALDKIEYHSGEPTFDDGWSAAIDYIQKKSLKPQNHWKPTEAQLASLTIACDRNDRIGFDLTQLLKELKKL